MGLLLSGSLFHSSPFNPSSPHAQVISDLFILVLYISVIIFLVVFGSLLYAILRYRGKPGQPDPAQEFGNTKIEIVWTAVPFLIVVFLCVFTVKTMYSADPPEKGEEPDLVIIGHQWWWEARYPKSGIVTANEIHIPVGKNLLVRLESADVIHDFWVPQLSRKMDAVPGHINYIWLHASEAGTYLGACSEYCGAQHAWMRIRVIAQPPEEFEAWQKEQLRVPTRPAKGEAALGAELFEGLTCVNCHAVSGTLAKAVIGPDLTHLASRQTLGAGVLENTPSNLAKWLSNPHTVKPGVLMPNMKLTENEINLLVAYLETLK
jgi:cytochrome c oxidase subunit 2